MTYAREPLCKRCRGFGVIRIRYSESGRPPKAVEVDDFAMCICRAGLWYREAGPVMVRQRIVGIQPESRIAWLEDFDERKPIPGEVFK